MLIKRTLYHYLRDYAVKFPVIAVVGPRQAGKTTLVREAFPDYAYFSLEDPDVLAMVRMDPRAFLEHNYNASGLIIDEFQNYPELLSYMQGIVDRARRPGYFILTGSHNFLMNQAISQSLAGRVAVLTLLPCSLKELGGAGLLLHDLNSAVFRGGYPSPNSGKLTPGEFYQHYTKTFVERDVRQLVNVVNLHDFQRFMQLCAGRIGQLLNVSSLADDCGISVPTVNAWLSILQASYVIFLVQPHFKNFSKRLIKSPKLYFYDTGLACWLLKISHHEQLMQHYLRGSLVESLMLAEIMKQFYHRVQEPSVYFWRDSHGHELDCLLDYGTKLVPIEIKASTTIQPRLFEGLHYWCNLAQIPLDKGYLVYGGSETRKSPQATLLSWKDIADVVL